MANFPHGYPVTSVCISEAGDQVFAGGTDGPIRAYDMRQQTELYAMRGHSDIVTGLRLSPDGTNILSNGADNTGTNDLNVASG